MKRYTVTYTVYDLDLDAGEKVVRWARSYSYWLNTTATIIYLHQVNWAKGDGYEAGEVVVELKDRYTGKVTSFQYTADEEKALYWANRYRDWYDEDEEEV